jgi:tetratricopeptide (TPR) repeat protein
MDTSNPTTVLETPSPLEDPPEGPQFAAAQWIPLLLIVATLLTFGRVVNHDFAPYDDEQTIRDNPRLNPARFTREGVLWYWDNSYMSLYAPLTYTVWGGVAQVSRAPTDDAGVFRLEPANFHLASLFLHVASVLLVYAILRRLLRGLAWPAAAGALLYGLHPLQVEAVAWASGMKDVLSGCLSFAAILLYLRAVTPPPPPADADPEIVPRIDPLAYGLALACFALAMLAKSSAMVTPLLLAIVDFAILRRSPERIAKSLAPWLALAIPIAVIARLVQTGFGVPAPQLWQRPVVAGASLAFYLEKLILPTGLGFEYGWRPVVMLQKGWLYAIALIPLAIGVILWIGRRRWSWLGAAALISIAALLPVLGFVPFMYQIHSTVADHYVYVAMLGPAIALAWGLSQINARRRSHATVVAGVLLAVLAGLSFAQLRHWRDAETVLQRTLAINPTSALAQNNMGQVYARCGEFDGAEQSFRASAMSNPDFVPAHLNLVIAYERMGRADDAIREFYEVRRTNELLPEDKRNVYSTDVFFQAGQAAARNHRYEAAARYFEEAVRVKPQDPRPRAALQQAREIIQAASTRPTSKPASR